MGDIHILRPHRAADAVQVGGLIEEVDIGDLLKRQVRKRLAEYTPERAQEITGVHPETIRTLPRQHLIIFRKKAGK